MASSSAFGGPSDGASFSEQLKSLHAANASTDHSHDVTIEDVVDEDDIQHPPPVVAPKASSFKKQGPLDVTSEEAFPSLAPSKASSLEPVKAWGKRPIVPPAATNGASNGISVPAASNARVVPVQQTPTVGQSISLPGRASEKISFAPHQILSRQQLKKPIPEILKEINKKSKANVQAREGGNGRIVFEGTGPQEAVRLALKEVASQIGSKQSIKIAVPLSVRPFLIGRQGQTIQGISKRSGARIQIPKQDDTPGFPDDEDATVDITVEGDAVAAELARQDIQKIIDERTSSVNLRLKDIPAEFYPFLLGPREANLQALMGPHSQDVNVSIPSYHTWHSVPPPTAAASGQPTPFIAQPHLPIRISGDRRAAQEVRERIERQTELLRRQLTSHQVPIERGRHQFIVGQDGDALHDLVAETGCSVIVPPANDDSETLYIIGPPDRIDNAVNRVLDTAASMSVSNIDLARQHAQAPPTHAHNLSRYLRERQAIQELERQYAASFVLPASTNSPASWQIFSKDGKQGMRARTEAMNLIAAHPPSRFHAMQVDPFYHNHLQSRAPQIRREHGVHLLFPPIETPDSHDLILIYEQPGSPSEYQFPRQVPSPTEIREHELAIQQALLLLTGIVGNRGEITSHQVEAPQKFHDRIQRYVERENRGLDENQIPAQLLFSRRGPPNTFQIRGLSNDVDDLNARIKAFIEQEKKDELERGFTTSFEYPHKIASHLIGKRGENIKKLQDEFDVEINYTEGKVELKGPQAKCEACKAHINSMVKRLGDETTHSIKVAPKYHADLKGQKGSQVLRLQERYNVRINFPRQIITPADDIDAATEHSFKNQPNQAPDVVTIRGPKKGADEARDELLNLLQYVVDNSHSTIVSVSAKQVPSLIGSGGRELESLRMETGCYVDVPKRDAAGDSSERVDIKLKGTKQAVEAAKKILLEKVKHFDDQVHVLVDIDQKHFKNIIGPGGATLQGIVTDAGGPEDRRLANRMVQFPKAGSNETGIRLQGSKAVVEKIHQAILARVAEKEGQITETIVVPAEKHRSLIGAGGSVRRKIDSDFSVEVFIPKAGEGEDVTITGQPENVAKAKAHIEGLLKEQASETVDVPKHLHHVVAEDGGQFFRRLRSDFGVNVDHAGEKPPTRLDTKVNGGTSEAAAEKEDAPDGSYSWELLHRNAPSTSTGEAGTIPWVLRGNAVKVTKARELLLQALSDADKPTSIGKLVLVDPKRYRFVIGPGGATVNGIRTKSGAQVAVPRQGTAGEHDGIEIKGPKGSVLKAKDMILEAVEKGGEGGNGGAGRRRRE